MKAVFVILHYLTAEDTLACVRSILGHPDTNACNYEIVIVDNNSNNGSLEILQAAFAPEPLVHLLPLTANLGFARGNNAGFAMAKNQLQADFIVMINNDTVIEQPGFLDAIVRKYEADPFDILGPDIVTLDQRHQNPKALAGFDRATLQRKIKRVRRDLWLTRTHVYNLLIVIDRLSHKNKDLQKSAGTMTQSENPAKSSDLPPAKSTGQPPVKSSALVAKTNIVPHGSCLIFSPRYVQKYKGIYSGTFLYCEEEILWYIAQQEQLKIVFWPQIQILHKEDRATLASTRTVHHKRIFKLTHELNSLRQLQAMMIDPQVYRSDLL